MVVLPPVAYSLSAAEKPPFAVTVEPVLALIAAHSLGDTASEIVIPIDAGNHSTRVCDFYTR